MEDDSLYDLYDNDDTALDYDDEPYDEQEAYLPKSPPVQEIHEEPQEEPREEPREESREEPHEESREESREESHELEQPYMEPSPSPVQEQEPEPEVKPEEEEHEHEPMEEEEEEEEKPPSPVVQPVIDEALNQKLEEQEEKIQDLESQLKDTQLQLDKLRNSFKDVALSCGVPFTSTRDPDPVAVLEAVQRMHTVRSELQEEGKQMRKVEAALQIHIAEKNMDTIELRRELHIVQQQADPSVIQLKQLLLDPAVNKEFQRLKSEVQDSHRELKHVKEELEVANFSQDHKTGRLLMQKCRALQDENEEMGKELSEGKQHQLETQLALSKEFALEMQKNFVELRDHCSMLDEESEELQMQMVALRRHNQELEMQLEYQLGAGQARMKQDGFFDRKGPAPGPLRPFDRKRPPAPMEKDMGRYMGRKRMR